MAGELTAAATVPGERAGERGQQASIAMWRLEPDPRAPGRIEMRNEQGETCFVSLDGGRSWRRADVAAA